jgi:hypothetical protein
MRGQTVRTSIANSVRRLASVLNFRCLSGPQLLCDLLRLACRRELSWLIPLTLHAEDRMAKGRRTTHQSASGTKLYAVRDAQGRFKDIQTYKRAHGADIKRKAAREQ